MWGQNWGEMVWGGGAPIPVLGVLGAGVLVGAVLWLSYTHLRRPTSHGG